MFGVLVRVRERWIYGAVVWSLLVTLTTALPPAAAETPAAPAAPADSASAPTLPEAKKIAKTYGHRVEALDRKAERVKVSANPNGTVRVEAHAQPVAIRDSSAGGDGWRDVDTSLVRSGPVLHPRVADADVEFSGDGSGPAVTVRHGAASWSLGWPTPLPAPSVSGAAAVYSGVAPSVDLQMWAGTQGFSQRIIIHERPSTAPVFDMPLVADGLQVTATPDDSLVVSDPAGAVLATSSPSVMWDARSTDPDGDDPSHYAPVDVSVQTTAAGQVLRLAPEPGFLADPATQYPVVVDPSTYTTNADTFITSGTQYQNTQYDGQELLRLGAGAEGNMRRTLMEILFNGHHLGKHIVDAKLELYEVSSGSDCANPKPFHVNRVQDPFDANNVTWATKPAASTTNWATVTSSAGYGTGCPNAWVSADITDLLQTLADGGANEGFQLRADNETATSQYKAFASLDSLTYPTADPRITMTLNSYPDDTAPPDDPTIYHNTDRPCLQATFSDPDGGMGRVQYEVWTYPATGASIKVAEFSGSTVPTGQISEGCVPAGSALDDGPYKWRAVGHDGLTVRQTESQQTDWSTWWTNIDVSTAPAVWSAEFSAGEWSYSQSGRIYAESPNAVEYRFDVDGASGLWTTASSIQTGTMGFGAHTVTVRARDDLGNESQVDFDFIVASTADRANDPYSGTSSTGETAMAPVDYPTEFTVAGGVASVGGKEGNGTPVADPVEAASDAPPAEIDEPGEVITWPALSSPMTEEMYLTPDDVPPPPPDYTAQFVLNGEDERKQVTSLASTTLANRRIGRFQFKNQAGNTRSCTAFFIDRDSIATNAHCVTGDDGPDADNKRDYHDTGPMMFAPARFGTYRPFGRCENVVDVWAPDGYRVDHQWTADYAVVNFSSACQSVGAETGSYALTTQGRYGMIARLAGYPGKVRGMIDGVHLYYMYGDLREDENEGRMWRYMIDTSPGNSGSPIVISAPSTPSSLRGKVAGIHSNGYINCCLGQKHNRGVKITGHKAKVLWAWAGKNGH